MVKKKTKNKMIIKKLTPWAIEKTREWLKDEDLKDKLKNKSRYKFKSSISRRKQKTEV